MLPRHPSASVGMPLLWSPMVLSYQNNQPECFEGSPYAALKAIVNFKF